MASSTRVYSMNTPQRRLIVFTRHPEPGLVKTRLIPALGRAAATALHRRLTLRTLRTANAAAQEMRAVLEIWYAGGTDETMHHWLGDSWQCVPQNGADLGERMSTAFARSFENGTTAVVLIGTDSPHLTPGILNSAFAALDSHNVVLGPARDGGYYLLGLTQPVPRLFKNIRWGTDQVLSQTLEILRRSNLEPVLLPELNDIDRPEDVTVWQEVLKTEEANLEHLSVILPTLNEAQNLRSVIERTRQSNPFEIIVADGGSLDATEQVARDAGANIVRSQAGRARQMNAGAALARGNVLLFLHADTFLPDSWTRAVNAALSRDGVAAGAFRFRLNGNFPGKRFIELATHCRSHFLQMPYGDQALFLRKATFEDMGGYSNLPILEDYEFVRRLRSMGRIVTVPDAAITSGRRWQRKGVFRTTLVNQLIIAAYHLGFDPRKLAALYRGRQVTTP